SAQYDLRQWISGADHPIKAQTPATQPQASNEAKIAMTTQNASSAEKAGPVSSQSAEPVPAPNVQSSASTPNRAAPVAAKRDSAAAKALGQAPVRPSRTVAHGSKNSDSSKKWSVQISAARARDVADTLVQQLKAKGYDGYVVQAEVKGQTYYRVRVGRFGAREKAESLRRSLERQEGYRGAYLTSD
ncbi:MAG TPA: SPOR domain-containing protein, partial [Terriglobales bacterium]|nr:SPOR domain-containing protein [Terriglobales bacterium]